jgi:hypothetical protein
MSDNPLHARLKDLGNQMSDIKVEDKIPVIEAIVDLWEQSPSEKGLTLLEFREGWAPLHTCMNAVLLGWTRSPSGQDLVYDALWQRMVLQVIRHDGFDPLYGTLTNNDAFLPKHLDFYLAQGLDVLSPGRQSDLHLLRLCHNRPFFPVIEHFLRSGEIDPLLRSSTNDERGNLGGYLLRESRHPEYIDALFSRGIHPDEFWTSHRFQMNGKDTTPLCATAFQYLANDFAGQFVSQFSTYWNADWYKLHHHTLNLCLEREADIHGVHPDTPKAYPSAFDALANALSKIGGMTVEERWLPCVEDTRVLFSRFYDHRLQRVLAGEAPRIPDLALPKPRI